MSFPRDLSKLDINVINQPMHLQRASSLTRGDFAIIHKTGEQEHWKGRQEGRPYGPFNYCSNKPLPCGAHLLQRLTYAACCCQELSDNVGGRPSQNITFLPGNVLTCKQVLQNLILITRKRKILIRSVSILLLSFD